MTQGSGPLDKMGFVKVVSLTTGGLVVLVVFLEQVQQVISKIAKQ
jgi:hypothetical protein